jgi:hypothetical protein
MPAAYLDRARDLLPSVDPESPIIGHAARMLAVMFAGEASHDAEASDALAALIRCGLITADDAAALAPCYVDALQLRPGDVDYLRSPRSNRDTTPNESLSARGNQRARSALLARRIVGAADCAGTVDSANRETAALVASLPPGVPRDAAEGDERQTAGAVPLLVGTDLFSWEHVTYARVRTLEGVTLDGRPVVVDEGDIIRENLGDSVQGRSDWDTATGTREISHAWRGTECRDLRGPKRTGGRRTTVRPLGDNPRDRRTVRLLEVEYVTTPSGYAFPVRVMVRTMLPVSWTRPESAGIIRDRVRSTREHREQRAEVTATRRVRTVQHWDTERGDWVTQSSPVVPRVRTGRDTRFQPDPITEAPDLGAVDWARVISDAAPITLADGRVRVAFKPRDADSIGPRFAVTLATMGADGKYGRRSTMTVRPGDAPAIAARVAVRLTQTA